MSEGGTLSHLKRKGERAREVDGSSRGGGGGSVDSGPWGVDRRANRTGPKSVTDRPRSIGLGPRLDGRVLSDTPSRTPRKGDLQVPHPSRPPHPKTGRLGRSDQDGPSRRRTVWVPRSGQGRPPGVRESLTTGRRPPDVGPGCRPVPQVPVAEGRTRVGCGRSRVWERGEETHNHGGRGRSLGGVWFGPGTKPRRLGWT